MRRPTRGIGQVYYGFDGFNGLYGFRTERRILETKDRKKSGHACFLLVIRRIAVQWPPLTFQGWLRALTKAEEQIKRRMQIPEERLRSQKEEKSIAGRINDRRIIEVQMNRIWIPNQSLGGVPFGCRENELRRFGDFVRIHNEEDAFVGWNVYGLEQGVRIYCEGGGVVSIAVYDSLLYRSCEVIGCKFDDIDHVIGSSNYIIEEPIDLESESQTPVDFDELGLQLWIRKGIVASATCNDGRVA